jgi:hypothetical protein
MPALEGKETNSSPLPIAYRKGGDAAFFAFFNTCVAGSFTGTDFCLIFAP